MKRRRRKDEEPKKEQLIGCWWEGGGRSGFVGRLTPENRPHPEDIAQAQSLASNWRRVAVLERRREQMNAALDAVRRS